MKRLIKRFVLALAVIMATAQIPCTAVSLEQEQTQYLVRLTENADLSDMSFSPVFYSDTLCVAENEEQLSELRNIGVVEEASVNGTLTTQADYSATQHQHVAIGAESAWNHTDKSGNYDCRGDGVTVAVIDSGTYEHKDFDLTKFKTVDEQYRGYTQWHGTFVAGVIAAQLNGTYADGISPNVNILSLCVTDKDGSTSTGKVVAAIDYAVKCGADVINLSISGPSDSTLLRQACQRATDAGVIIVSCSGNTASEETATTTYYPAAYDCVVCVASCTDTANGWEHSSFSCYNDSVDISAPGDNIVSLHVDGGAAIQRGTSFAAPVVASMAALAKQQDPDITTDEFMTLLRETCDDVGEPGKDKYFGYGVVNLTKFVDAICKKDDGTGKQTEEKTIPTFEDVTEKDYYFDAVQWAAENEITGGMDKTHFAPNGSATRGQMVTFLWRAAGCPEPETTECKFTDVSAGQYYYKAVLWAVENGITKGAGGDTFAPNGTVTRCQAVTFLWRAQGAAKIDAEIPFDDVSEKAYYADAVRWAVANDITSGVSKTSFGPDKFCKRAQIVTFLWRTMEPQATQK